MRVLLFALSTAIAFGQSCDRACLEGFVDQYMDALIAHNPKLLPVVARNFKNTENGQRLDPGDGFWRTATAKGTYRIFVTDVANGSVAFLGTMKEANIPVGIAIRLKVANRQVSEVETFVVRGGMGNTQAGAELEKRGTAHPLFAATIPANERMSREDLIKVANQYFTGLERNDGKGSYPFADDCDRIEDGIQTTNNPSYRAGSGFAPPAGSQGKQAAPPPPPPGPTGPNVAAMSCKAQFESGYYRYVTRIRDRRFVAVDPERGLVFTFVFFDNAAGKNKNFQLADGTPITAGPHRPWSWEIAEMFRIEKGKIRRVESLLEQVPYGMLSGWSSYEDGMSSRAR